MKMSKLFAIFLILLAGCKKDKTVIKEVPDGIVHTTPCESLYSKVLELLPYSQDNKDLESILFKDTVQKNIILTTESKVFLTFVNENAYSTSSIGWYSYNKSSVPQNSAGINKQILFPNASLLNSGGELSSGDMLQVGTGTFKAGTVIGFFLIADGWQNKTINWGQTVLYTNFVWNTNENQQHVLYKDTVCNKIVLSWEDTAIELGSDQDFNDLVFTVSDNEQDVETVSFETTSLVKK
jgi:hypothetical protein